MVWSGRPGTDGGSSDGMASCSGDSDARHCSSQAARCGDHRGIAEHALALAELAVRGLHVLMSNEISCEIEAPLPRGLTIFSLIDNDVLHDAIMIVEANVYGDVLDVFGAADVVDINDDTARRGPSPEHGNNSKLSPPPLTWRSCLRQLWP